MKHTYGFFMLNSACSIKPYKNSIIEEIAVLQELYEIINTRNSEHVKDILRRDEISECAAASFRREVDEFYETCADYLQKWSLILGELDVFK